MRDGQDQTVFADVAAILQTRCVECHQGDDPAAGYRVESFLDVIACVPDGTAAILPADDTAPLIAILADQDHKALLTNDEQRRLRTWVADGALARLDRVHPPGFVDPRSADWHGLALAAEHWHPMLDMNAEGACGQCHAGTPGAVLAAQDAVPGATACTTCHTQPEGVLACNTCHGDDAHVYPPRDPCFFADGADAGAHEAHVTPSPIRALGLTCEACHPTVPTEVIAETHANGMIDVVFAPGFGGVGANYDPDTGTCTVACHNRNGDRPIVAWNEAGPLDCNSCHRTPPLNHFRAACSSCHIGIDAEGTTLSPDAPHINGQLDFRQ